MDHKCTLRDFLILTQWWWTDSVYTRGNQMVWEI